MEVSDLQNYLSADGVIYFVVYISPKGNSRKVFYCSLLPAYIKNILEEAGDKKTKRVRFKPFPSTGKDLLGLLMSFIEHRNKQANVKINNKPFDVKKLLNEGILSKITLVTAGSKRYDSPIEALLHDEVYLD